MTLSGTYDYTVSAQDIIEGALRSLGVIASGETPTAAELADGLEALNLLVKSWQHSPNPIMSGVKAWHRVENTIDVASVGAKQCYTLAGSGADVTMQIPVDIIAVTRVSSDGDRTRMTRVTLDTFTTWGDRTDTGTPSHWFYERGLTSGKLWFNLLTYDTTDDYVITSLRPLQDLDALANDVEFTQEWYRALKFNLAVELAPEFQIEVGPTLAGLAQQAFALANFASPDETSAYFQPGVD